MRKISFCILSLIISLFLSVQIVSAQTTAFNYQGSLKSGGNLANGNFDFEFALFDAVSGGTQIGSTISANSVAVSNGIFSVSLNFGSLFPGTNRFLEIRVRQTGIGAFTVLTPRQSVNSSPYSIKSLLSETTNNALSLGGIAANQYVTTTNGGANFIQNQQTVAQPSTDFWISGRGSANILNAGTEFQISGSRILSITGTSNIFAGVEAGQFNTTGIENSFFGTFAGYFNNVGSGNSFFGFGAGSVNVNGSMQSDNNSFFGKRSGSLHNAGTGNTFIGAFSDTAFNCCLTNATAIGFRAEVAQDNSLILGSVNGVNDAISDTNVGIGTTTPAFRLDVVGRSRFKQNAQSTGTTNTAGFWLFQNTPNADRAFIGMETDNSVGFYGNNNGGWGFVMNTQTGVTSVRQLGSAGSTALCRNASNDISTCSSSFRYKTNINPFSDGLSFINQLQPISFDWKDGGMHDVGFGAEDVANINPLFVNYNDKGEVEGVKYDRLSVAFVNAFKEQQKQIEQQNETIKRQQTELDGLKNFVCSQNPTAEFCQSK